MRFTKQVFTSDVTLDYNEFVDCVFKDCTVFFHGGTFTLVRTTFNNVRFGVADSANRALEFLRLVRAHDPALLEQLLNAAPAPAKDQSVTIN